MTDSAQELTLTYLEAHPADAARVLEHVPPRDAAALFDEVPARICAPVLRNMFPTSAARCLDALNADVAAGLLQSLGPQAGAAVLRHLSEQQRASVFERLPSSTALAFRLLLSYPDDTVGAWMDTRAIAFSADTPAGEALARVRADDDALGNYLYVVDSEQRLRGVARLPDVVRAGESVALGQIMNADTRSLPARAPITAVRSHAGWHDYHSLAVVERHDRFVGALHFATLSHALSRQRPAATPAPFADALGTLAGAYWSVFSGLIQSALGVLTTSAPTARNGERRDR